MLSSCKRRVARTLRRWSCLRWDCWKHWRLFLQISIVLLDILVLLVVLPILIWQLQEAQAKVHVQLWFVAGLFMVLSIPVFLFGLVQHLTNYTRPNLQRHIIRILWIVPIYSVDAFIGLRIPNAAIYVDTLRECYEAYVIYNFLCYLLNYLDSEYDLGEELRKMNPVRCPLPFCCLPPKKLDMHFILRCKFGVLQYTVLRLLVTGVAFITKLCNVYGEGEVRFDRAWLYLAIINTISQGIALQTLIYFYKAVSQLLEPIQPVGKFLSIKAIIFFAFWQSIGIAILEHFGLLRSDAWQDYGIDNVALGLQDFLICIEMFVAAVVHYFVFSHKPYAAYGGAKVPCFGSFMRMLDVRDVGEDMKEQALHFQSRAKYAAVSAKNAAALVLRVPGTGASSQTGEAYEMVPLLQEGTQIGSRAQHTNLPSPRLQSTVGALYTADSSEVQLAVYPVDTGDSELHMSHVSQPPSGSSGGDSSASSSASGDASTSTDSSCSASNSESSHS